MSTRTINVLYEEAEMYQVSRPFSNLQKRATSALCSIFWSHLCAFEKYFLRMSVRNDLGDIYTYSFV